MAASSEVRRATRDGLERTDNVAERLAELGLSMSTELQAALTVAMDAQAHRVAASGAEAGTRVTRTTALISSMMVDDHVRKAGYAADLDWDALVRDAGLDGWSPPQDLAPASDAPFHERALGALETYRKQFGDDRPTVDPIGLAWALVAGEPGRFHDRIREAGAEPDALASMLWRTIERQRPSVPEASAKQAPPVEMAGRDEDLARVQRVLERLGLDPGPADGIVGPLTRKAVLDFQNAAGLDADGQLGPVTRAALEERTATWVVDGLRSRQLDVAYAEGQPMAVAIDADGRPVIVDLETGDTIDPPGGTAVSAVTVAAGAGTPVLVAARSDGALDVTDLATLEPRHAFTIQATDVESVSAAWGDGELAILATASTDADGTGARQAWVVGTDIPTPLSLEAGADGRIFRHDGSWIRAAVDRSTGAVKRTDVRTGKTLGRPIRSADQQVDELELGGPADDPLLITSGGHGLLERHRASDGDNLGLVGPNSVEGDNTRLFAADRTTLAISTVTGRVRRFVLATGAEIDGAIAIPSGRRIVSLGIADSSAGTAVAAIDRDGALWSWIGPPSVEEVGADRLDSTETDSDAAPPGPEPRTEDVPRVSPTRADFARDYVRLGAWDERDKKITDRLKIESDVGAMSRLAMAVDIVPPVSIGLFGDWGTGKTYFMGLMSQEVRKLEAVAQQAHDADRSTVYCRDVVQIHFNAWHFIDTNLWASIVTHIFGQLADHFDADGSKPNAWDRTLQEATRSGAKLKDAKNTVDRLTTDRDDAQQRVAALEEQVGEPEQDAARAAQDLGIEEPETAVQDLDRLVGQIRSLPGRARSLWHILGGADDSTARRVGISLLACAVVVVPALLAWLVPTELSEAARLVFAAVVAVIGGMFDRFVTLRDAVDTGSKALRDLEDARDAIQTPEAFLLREARAVARQELEQRELALEDARAELDDAERFATRVRRGEFVGDFIRAQSEKPDYKSQLGIINEIRHDFEGLSKVLRKTSAANSEIGRLDRIILYIDDLDRCPTERVVEVLQAIHLLLIFELFVVVVGVDSRWLMHALEEQYSAFGAVGGPSTIERLRWRTTPQNYLEKIFQIPFTLRPMGETGFAELIEHLTEEKQDEQPERAADAASAAGAPDPDRTTSPATEPVAATRPEVVREPGSTRAEGSTPAVVQDDAETSPEIDDAVAVDAATADTEGDGAGVDATAAETAADDAGAATSPGDDDVSDVDETSDGAGTTEGSTIDTTGVDPSPPELRIRPHERKLMASLDELVPTPRAAKRLVNLYRLVKATITADVDRFEGTEEQPGDFQAVLLMLAMQAGFPTQSYEIFRYLGTQPPSQRWWDLVAGLEPDEVAPGGDGIPHWRIPSLDLHGLSEGEAEIWRELEQALAAAEPEVNLADETLEPFTRYAGAVARFGFITGRAVRPERAEPHQGALTTVVTADDTGA